MKITVLKVSMVVGNLFLITIFYLYFPAIFSIKQSSALSNLPNVLIYESLKEGSDEDVSSFESSDCASCSSMEDESDAVDDSLTHVQHATDMSQKGVCHLSKEKDGDNWSVYENSGLVYLSIKDGTASSKKAAYNFIRDQGCVLSDSNLIWL